MLDDSAADTLAAQVAPHGDTHHLPGHAVRREYQAARAGNRSATLGNDEHVTASGVVRRDVVQVGIERLVHDAETLAETVIDEPLRGRLVIRSKSTDTYGAALHCNLPPQSLLPRSTAHTRALSYSRTTDSSARLFVCCGISSALACADIACVASVFSGAQDGIVGPTCPIGWYALHKKGKR